MRILLKQKNTFKMMCEIPRLGNIVAPQALRKVQGTTSPPTKAL